MSAREDTPEDLKPAGYEALVRRYGLEVIPNWHRSFVGSAGSRRASTAEGFTEEVYPRTYWPGDSLGGHLEFALKYDGTNLGILASVFEAAPQAEFLAYVESKPWSVLIKVASDLGSILEHGANRFDPLPPAAEGKEELFSRSLSRCHPRRARPC